MATAWLGFVLLLALTGASSAQSTCVNSPIPASPTNYELTPDNNVAPNALIVFPDRDFVTVEGFSKYEGCDLLVEVVRSGKVVGSAIGTVSGSDVAFEINHPGGYCWGAGTGLKVTPDITGGDLVRLKYPATAAGEVIGQTLTAKEVIKAKPELSALSGTTALTVLTIQGTVAAGVNPDFLEQRIIAPELVGTAVNRRDVRALNGGLAAAPKGGYISSLTVHDDNTFTARYEFDTAELAKLAAAGGPRIMSWGSVDEAGNRISLTISEFGELGGPGLGGCPAGPADAAAPAGSAAARAVSDIGAMRVDWTPVTEVPGAAAVTGYSVLAIDPTTNVQTGQRTGASGRVVTIEKLDKTVQYTVEVRSIAAKRMSEPFDMIALTPASTGGGLPADQKPPEVAFTPAVDPTSTTTQANSVTLASVPANDALIYYTLNDVKVVEGDQPSADAILYQKAIPITEKTTVNYIAIDAAGNSFVGTATFSPVLDAAPTKAPLALPKPTSAEGQEELLLAWSQPEDPNVATWEVQLHSAAAATPEDPKDDANKVTTVGVNGIVKSTVKSVTIKSLTAGTSYWFKVRGVSQQGKAGPWSLRVGPLKPSTVTDRLSITSAKWKAGDFRVIGTGSKTGALIRIRSKTADGALLGTGTVTAPVAPATVGDISIRVRNGGPTTNPGTIYLTSDFGGVAGPFTVANGRRRQLL